MGKIPACRGESIHNKVTDTPYSDLASLRAALTDDDPDRRASAYQAVLEADIQPSAVLSGDPPAKALAKAGVIPVDEQSDKRPAYEQREEMIQLLQKIAGSGGS